MPSKKTRGNDSIFHRPEWEQVYATYGLQYHRLVGKGDGDVLPVVALTSRFFGRQLVSLPWFDAAGCTTTDERGAGDLCNQALRLAAELKIPVVQIRQAFAAEVSPHVRTDKVVQRLQLSTSPDELWDRLKATVRNQVRKAEKSGLVVERANADRVGDFFEVYSQNMRDLGSPSHSRKLFATVLRVFPQEAALYLVQHEGTVVGGGLTLANGDTLEIPWASSRRDYNQFCVNHAMYWHILEQACRDGFSWFSFGRSTVGSGPYRYKKQWGPDELPLHWYFLGRRDVDAVSAAVPPQEKFGLASRFWTKLPLFASRRLGPFIMARVP